MGTNYNQKIPVDGLTFYADVQNAKSFVSGVLKSLVSSDISNTNYTKESGYLYSNTGYIDDISNINLVQKNAITTSTFVYGTNLNNFAFTFYDEESDTYKPSTNTTKSYTEISTAGIGVTNQQTQYSVTGLTTKSYTEITTSGSSTINQTTTYSGTGLTTKSYTEISTSGSGVVNQTTTLTDTEISTISGSPVTTSAINVYRDFNPSNLLTLSFKNNVVYAIRKISGRISQLVYTSESTSQKNLYTVVFRKLNGTTIPISIFENGISVANSESITGNDTLPSQFKLSLMNYGGAYYPNYGIRLMSLYGRELNSSEIASLKTLLGA